MRYRIMYDTGKRAYYVQQHMFWFFWDTLSYIDANDNWDPIFFDTVEKAENYINSPVVSSKVFIKEVVINAKH